LRRVASSGHSSAALTRRILWHRYVSCVLAAGVLSLGSWASALPKPDFGDHEYTIAVRLDPSTHEVTGQVVIRYRNRSSAPLHDLVFHLYPNAFEHDETVFMREGGGSLRGIEGDGYGGISVHSLTIDGIESLERAETELIPKDRTQLRLPLITPLPPAGVVKIAVAFTTRLPFLFARSGHVGRFHVVAQFFPKLAKLSSKGEWRSFPYHGLGEFFADFADYELFIEAPPDLQIVASGVRGPIDTDGPWPVHQFRAEAVHDVAFVAWDRFESREGRCHGVRVHLHHPRGGAAIAERSFELACAAFLHFGRDLFPYPYKDLSIVFPPKGAEGGEGMEYPQLILSSAGTLHPPGLRFLGPDVTTAHELAHQWFQGVVATDEVRHPMLDEGLSTYFGYDLLTRIHGRARSGNQRPPLDVFELTRMLLPERVLSPARPVFAFPRETELYASIYGHFPLALETFARTYGRAKMTNALGRFAREFRFRHPGPDDLIASFETVYSAWFVREVIRPALFDGKSARFSLKRAQVRGNDLEVIAIREGSLPLPTVVAVTYADGRVERLPFPAERTQLAFERPSASVVRVEIDPDRHVLLDPDRSDQIYLARSWRGSITLWMALRALFAGLFG
jgi:hypothetical protein